MDAVHSCGGLSGKTSLSNTINVKIAVSKSATVQALAALLCYLRRAWLRGYLSRMSASLGNVTQEISSRTPFAIYIIIPRGAPCASALDWIVKDLDDTGDR